MINSFHPMLLKKYAVIGHPVSYSLSAIVQNTISSITNSQISYRRIIPLRKTFKEIVGELATTTVGANITAPFKRDAFNVCHSVTQRAKTLEAVNTIRFSDGKVYGDNTDGVGIIEDIRKRFGRLRSKTIIILGSGGTVKSILMNVIAELPETVVLLARNTTKLEAIINETHTQIVRAGVNVWCYQLEEVTTVAADVIINTTPINPFRTNSLKRTNRRLALAYDIRYQPMRTEFLSAALKLGAVTFNGIGMLVEQAIMAFKFWNSTPIDASNANKIVESLVHY